LVAGNILGVAVELTASPVPVGLKQQAAVANGAISEVDKGVLIASGASSKLHWASYGKTGSWVWGTTGLAGQFAVCGWMTLDATWSSGLKYIFDYYYNASNRISIVYDADNGYWTITKIVGGTTYTANSAADSVSDGDDIHLVLIQDATTLYLYANGSLAASVAAAATMTDNGLIALGCPGTGTVDGVDVILDGWRVLPEAITGTQAGQLYTAELPIKQAGRKIGPPPYWWTKDGDGKVDNADDAGRDNWGILGGVAGDLEAETQIIVSPVSSVAYKFYAGFRAVDPDATYDPADYHWLDVPSEATSDAGSSGGNYYTASGSNQEIQNYFAPADFSLLFGRYRHLIRVKASTALTLTYGWAWNTEAYSNFDYLLAKATRTISNTGFEIVDLGDLFINSDAQALEKTPLFSLKYIFGGSATSGLDFSFLLPWPYARIVSAEAGVVPSGLFLEEGRAYEWVNLGWSESLEYTGAPLRAAPGKYNYFFLLMVRESTDDFVITDTATLEMFVTPRYLLPGGMVA
jgi:Concanavalin A-like lectin/glucanases superfamily